jgi:hypothetical protein
MLGIHNLAKESIYSCKTTVKGCSRLTPEGTASVSFATPLLGGIKSETEWVEEGVDAAKIVKKQQIAEQKHPKKRQHSSPIEVLLSDCCAETSCGASTLQQSLAKFASFLPASKQQSSLFQQGKALRHKYGKQFQLTATRITSSRKRRNRRPILLEEQKLILKFSYTFLKFSNLDFTTF